MTASKWPCGTRWPLAACRRLAIAACASATTIPVHAQALAPVSGPHGNPSGCLMAQGGQPEGDDILLLTPRSVETYATLCEFVAGFPASSEDTVLLAVCAHEGEETRTVGFIRLRPAGPGFDVFGGDGGNWGRALPCP